MDEGPLKEAKTFFMEGNKTSDAIIQVGDHELHVDLVIISLASPTLASEFQPRPDPNSAPGETNKAVAKLVEPADHIVDMLTSVYPNFRNVVDKDNVEYLLPLAVKYKLPFLQQACENAIVQAVPQLSSSSEESKIKNDLYHYRGHKDRLMRYFVLADKHKLVNARQTCMDKLVKCTYSERSYSYGTRSHSYGTPTRNMGTFQTLQPSTRWEILRNRLFYLEGTYGYVRDNLEDLSEGDTPREQQQLEQLHL